MRVAGEHVECVCGRAEVSGLRFYFKALGMLLLSRRRFNEIAADYDISRELETNKELRSRYPSGELPPDARKSFEDDTRERTEKLRTGYFAGLFYVVVAVVIAWASGNMIHRMVGPPPPLVSDVLHVVSAAMLLGATLSKLGWELQTIKDRTLAEKFNRHLFRFLMVTGTYLLIMSLSWSSWSQ